MRQYFFHRAHVPTIHAPGHACWPWRVVWFSIPMHACCSVPVVMVTHLTAIWAAKLWRLSSPHTPKLNWLSILFFCLQSLLPRGKQPNPLREKHFQVNHTLKEAIETIPNSIYLVSDPGFVRSDGTISHEDMGDYLHLTRKGYKKLCQHIHHVIVKFLKYWAELLKEARGMNEVQISPFFLKKRVARRALLVSIRGTGIKTVIPVVAK